MTLARFCLGTLFYWMAAIILVSNVSGVPCPAATDCETPAFELFRHNLAIAATLYVILITALFIAFHLSGKVRK